MEKFVARSKKQTLKEDDKDTKEAKKEVTLIALIIYCDADSDIFTAGAA